MRWVYRLQQQVAVTQQECNVILVLVFIFCLGFAAHYVRSQPSTLPDSVYAEADRLFAARSAKSASKVPNETPVIVASAPATTPHVAQRMSQTATPSGVRMNINKATASQLQRLPRIGPKLAERIITHRETHGLFQQVQDLTQVRGIGEKTLARLEPLIFVEQAN